MHSPRQGLDSGRCRGGALVGDAGAPSRSTHRVAYTVSHRVKRAAPSEPAGDTRTRARVRPSMGLGLAATGYCPTGTRKRMADVTVAEGHRGPRASQPVGKYLTPPDQTNGVSWPGLVPQLSRDTEKDRHPGPTPIGAQTSPRQRHVRRPKRTGVGEETAWSSVSSWLGALRSRRRSGAPILSSGHEDWLSRSRPKDPEDDPSEVTLEGSEGFAPAVLPTHERWSWL